MSCLVTHLGQPYTAARKIAEGKIAEELSRLMSFPVAWALPLEAPLALPIADVVPLLAPLALALAMPLAPLPAASLAAAELLAPMTSLRPVELEHYHGLQDHVVLTPRGSRVYIMERTTPGGTRLTAEYTSPNGTRYEALDKLRLSERSMTAQARKRRKAGVPARRLGRAIEVACRMPCVRCATCVLDR